MRWWLNEISQWKCTHACRGRSVLTTGVRVGQKLHTKLMATILSSLNRFSKFAERFSSKFVVVDIKDPCTTMTTHCIIMLPHHVHDVPLHNQPSTCHVPSVVTQCLHFTTGWMNCANKPSQAALERASQDVWTASQQGGCVDHIVQLRRNLFHWI